MAHTHTKGDRNRMQNKSSMLKLIPFIFDHYHQKSFDPLPAFFSGEMCINAIQKDSV